MTAVGHLYIEVSSDEIRIRLKIIRNLTQNIEFEFEAEFEV